MMNNQRFDEHIKTQLSGLEPDVPAHIWDNIVAERRKRKPVPFWASFFTGKNLLILFSLIFSGLTATWLINRATTSSVPGESSIAQAPVKNINTSSLSTGTKPATADQITSNAESTLPGTEIKDNSPVSFVPYNTTVQTERKNHYAPGKYKVTTAAGAFDTETMAVTDLPKKQDLSVRDEPTEEGDIIPSTGTLYNRLLMGIEKNKGRQKNALDILNRKAPNVIVPKCPVEKDAAGNKKYVEVYGAYDYGMQSLKDTGTNSTYLQKRKESTKFSSGFSAGIRYTKVFNNSISIRGGLNFSQITEKFSFAQGNLIQITYIINANGDTTGSYTTTGTRYKTTYNKYRSIDIPLLVGYEMGNGRFHTNINAGPVINIYSWQKGEVLDVNNQPVSITTGKSNSPYGFKTNTGIGFMGAVSLYYKLTENLHLMAEPYFRYNFGQMNRTELTIKQKYNTIGFKLGVRLDIP